MDNPQPYQQALDYLYSYVDHSLTRSARYSPEMFDLSRMNTLMQALGNPHQEYPAIHIAGTKGKGSVSAFCANALRYAGYRVGLYTSPHLSDFVERIQLNGQPISHNQFAASLEAIKPHVESIPQLTTFEIATGLAFDLFAHEGADIAVIEVGLGGRLDATNVVTPLTSVITSISYDHTQFLGSTLPEIATEKAGIIKPGIPVILAPQQEEVRLTIGQIARQRDAPLIVVGRDYLFAPTTRSLNRQTLLVWPKDEQPMVDAYIESGGSIEWEPLRLTIPLLGIHQVENAATAYAALDFSRQRGVAIGEQAIREGFATVSWPARFELLHEHPPIVADSAHNRDSALKLRLALDDYFPGLPVILVFGASEDKDIQGMFTELLPRVRSLVATRSTHPRAMNPDDLVTLAHQFGKKATPTESIEHAIDLALELADSEAVILITGSLFIAAGARDVIKMHPITR